MVLASTRPGDWCLDPFAGSGTLGRPWRERCGRHFVLIDTNSEAVSVMRTRLATVPKAAESSKSLATFPKV